MQILVSRSTEADFVINLLEANCWYSVSMRCVKKVKICRNLKGQISSGTISILLNRFAFKTAYFPVEFVLFNQCETFVNGRLNPKSKQILK